MSSETFIFILCMKRTFACICVRKTRRGQSANSKLLQRGSTTSFSCHMSSNSVWHSWPWENNTGEPEERQQKKRSATVKLWIFPWAPRSPSMPQKWRRTEKCCWSSAVYAEHRLTVRRRGILRKQFGPCLTEHDLKKCNPDSHDRIQNLTVSEPSDTNGAAAHPRPKQTERDRARHWPKCCHSASACLLNLKWVLLG